MHASRLLLALTAAALTLAACSTPSVQQVAIPSTNDPNNWRAPVQERPLPADATGGMQPMPGVPDGGVGGAPPAPLPGGVAPPAPMPGPAMGAPPPGPDADAQAFLTAYEARRSPRIMVLVNRTIHAGAALPADTLEAMARNNKTVDDFRASAADYDLIEASLVKYFDDSGKVDVKDSEAARGKLDREKFLRLENGDPDTARLLNAELQTDILIRVVAQPTFHANGGMAIRLICRAVGTTDARMYGTAFVDMPLPISKTNVNIFTRYLTLDLMREMTKKFNGAFDPLEVRIYKATTVDETLLIRKFIQKVPGVTSVLGRGATGGSRTAYSVMAVSYSGAPEDFYAVMKENVKLSKGLKAVDIQNNTVSVEIEGALALQYQTIALNADKKPELQVRMITLGGPDDDKIVATGPVPAGMKIPAGLGGGGGELSPGLMVPRPMPK